MGQLHEGTFGSLRRILVVAPQQINENWHCATRASGG